MKTWRIVLLYALVIFQINGSCKISKVSGKQLQSVPQIDGIIEENEWPDFQEILLPYWTTFKEGTIYGAEPWDTKDKICNYSIRSKNNHIYFCLQIPDNYIGENYTRAILSIYLDDHTQDFYDRKTIIWGDKEDIGIYQKKRLCNRRNSLPR